MIKYFTKSFKILNDNIILTTPLVLFIIILVNFHLIIVQNLPKNIYILVSLGVTTLSMFAAFFSGWFYMVKKAIQLDKKTFDDDTEKAKASLGLMKELTSGIGEYFLSFVGFIILYVGLFIALGIIGTYVGNHFIGNPHVDLNQLKESFNSREAMQAFITSIPIANLKKLNQWYLLFLAAISGFYYITLFWGASIIYKVKNPLVAFFKSFIFTFKNFLATILIYIYISILNLIASFAATLAGANNILYFIATLLSFYFIVYFIVLIFLYYDTKLQETENNSYSGTDSIGENELCNPESFDE